MGKRGSSVLGAALAAFFLSALPSPAPAEAVSVADCERDPAMDEWAAADARFASAVMDDVFALAGVEPRDVPFGPDGIVRPGEAEVLKGVFRTPAIAERYDFPVQPIGRMHFGLYASPERAKRMMSVKITDWPRMRVGYSPVSQGRDTDRERYFTHATLTPEYVEYPTSKGAVDGLRAGEVDLLFLYTPYGKRPEGLTEIVPIGSRNVYFAVRKDRPELKRRLESAYRECYISNVARYDALREELLGVPTPTNRVRVAAYMRGHLFAVNADGERSGVVEEWLNAIAGQTHWNFDYVYGNYEESLADVASGRLDMVGGLGFSASRSEMFLYPHTPIGMLRVYLWTKRGSRFRAGDPASWRGMRVGILNGALSAQRVKKQLEGNTIDVECVEYATDGELTKAYFGGEIDACVNIEMPALDKERALHIYASHPMYLCVTPSKRPLFLELEKALDGVCDDFPKYMRMITERHYGIRSEMSVLTLKEAEWLKERVKDPSPVMINFSPWPRNLKNANGENVYFVGALLKELEARTGLKFDTEPQTGIQTAEARFLRGDAKFWIPYPAQFDVAAAGGVSVFSIPVPRSYAHVIGADGSNDEMEMWANRDVPDELVGIIRKAVSGIEPMTLQEMFIKAASDRQVERVLFGFTVDELKRLAAWATGVALSVVAAFALFMILALKRQVVRANEAARTAEEYSKAKTRFLAMMSHELRTPLNAVIGFAEFLSRPGCEDGKRREYVDGIRLSATALLDLINDILDLSKLDSGAMHMRTGECDVGKAIEELPAIFGYHIKRSGVAFSVRRTGERPIPVVRLSQQGLRQILINLVGNAAKFTEKGRIDVEFSWRDGTDTLHFSVRDTGRGISAEKMAHLFDPFVQDIASRMNNADSVQKGTGLGLPIVKRMVDAAGGTIEVSSEIGKGTLFTIDIPGLEIVRESVRDTAPSASFRLPESALVVDDMAINRRILGIHLKNLGVGDIRFAENGRDALGKMADWRPDVVLSDMWMPEMDGAALAKAMKADPALSAVPVMAITADVDVASTYDMSAFSRVIAKPVTSEKLKAMFATA